MPLWPKITLTLLALVLSACSHLGQADELSAPLTSVNYTDWPFDWVGVTKVETPNQTMAADRVSAFSASGLMCCVILPREWRKGMELIVATRDGTRAETPEEWSKEKMPTIQHRVPVPPYTPQDMGTVWVQLLPGGKVVLVVSRYDPDHPSWPGEVKGWPVPTLEFRRQIWDRDMDLMRKNLEDFESAVQEGGQEAEKYKRAAASVRKRMEYMGTRP
jgi:Protein of unknown function (DUF3304)